MEYNIDKSLLTFNFKTLAELKNNLGVHDFKVKLTDNTGLVNEYKFKISLKSTEQKANEPVFVVEKKEVEEKK